MERPQEQPRDLATEDIAGANHPGEQRSPATEGQRAPQPVAGAPQHEQGLDSPHGPGGDAPANAAAAPAAGQGHSEAGSEPLLGGGETDEFRRRWESIQIQFVDEPRQAVEDADGLVAEVIRRLAENFSEERARLEGQWGRGEDVPTDDLRVTLQRYRSFFQRLLST